MKRCKWTLAAIPVLLFATAHAASPDMARVEVTRAVHQDTLPSLRDVAPDPAGYKQWHAHEEHMIPLPYMPPNQADGAVQDFRGPGGLFAPTFQSGVDGVGKGFSGPQGAFTVQYAPPDTVGAVGATQYVQVVNVGFAVFNKSTKAVVYGPVPTNTLWSGFGGQCQSDNDGDAIVVYDKVGEPLDHLAVRGRHDAVPAMRRRLADLRRDRRLVSLLVLVRQRVPGLSEDGRLARCVLRDVQHVHRQLVLGLQALRLQPERDADRRRRDAAVLPAVIELRRRAAVRSRRIDRAARGRAELHAQLRHEPR